MADHGVTHVVAEVSSHALDLRRVDDCAFDLGIFTNLTQDHLDYHRTMENYFQAKKRFFSEVLPAGGKTHPQKMIINADDPWGQRILREVGGGRLTYGLETPCDVTASSFHLSLDGIEATLLLGGDRLSISSRLMGRFNLYNILAAAAAALALGIPDRAHPGRDRGVDPCPGTSGEGQRGGAARRFCRLRPHGRRPATGPPESLPVPDGKNHHRLRVRRRPGPGKTAAHGRGRNGL